MWSLRGLVCLCAGACGGGVVFSGSRWLRWATAWLCGWRTMHSCHAREVRGVLCAVVALLVCGMEVSMPVRHRVWRWP